VRKVRFSYPWVDCSQISCLVNFNFSPSQAKVKAEMKMI
jgi:hypothetical protein